MNIFLNKNANAPIVVGTGFITLDIILNQKIDVPTQVYAGGTCGNILTILGYLGWNSYPVARLNGDVASQKVVQDLEKWNLKTNFLKLKPVANTPIIVQEIKENSRGESYHKYCWTCPQCGAWLPPFKAVIAKSITEVIDDFPKPQVFFFDRVSRGALTLAKKFASEGAIIFFEPSGTGDLKLFKEALELSHVVKYAEDRAVAFKELIAEFSPLIEIETLSKRGLRFRRHLYGRGKCDWSEVRAFSTKVVDAAGAGDWCSAGIIHSLFRSGFQGISKLSEESFSEALRIGQVLASWACGFEGARGGMYHADKKDLNNFIKQTLSNNLLFHVKPKNSINSNLASEYSCPSCIPPVEPKQNSFRNS